MADPKAQAQRFYGEVLNKGRTDLLDEMLTDDFVEHEELPGMSARNRDAVLGWVTMLRGAFPDLHAEIEDMISEGDRIAVRAKVTGTHMGEFMGVAPTERRVELKVIDIVRFTEDGRAAEHWGLSDDLGLMQQLGVVPEEITA